ncbi:MAG TPA: Ppx/GppA phosphatase family protein [Candidatus Binataceae bacterium]|nr:Ppx/GppA phosphatase family protein [Candidatus Binataceae bacterium]
MKLAAFDVGTNTVLMLLVESDGDGKFTPLMERSRITRLGKGVDRTGRLDKETSRLTLDTIAEFAEAARTAGAEKIIAAATSALRDASDGADFIQRVKEKAGVDLKIIPGAEEAELSRLAVKRSLNLSSDLRLLIADIGGGSTELIRSEPGRGLTSVSLQIGSVRLTERIIQHDPPTQDEIAKLTATIDEHLEKLGWSFHPDVLVGIAGTVTTIAAVALNMSEYDGTRVQGYVLMRDEVSAIVKRFADATIEERKKIPGVLEARADVIFAGSVILERVMKRFDVGHVVVSDQGVRWGLVWRELEKSPTAAK